MEQEENHQLVVDKKPNGKSQGILQSLVLEHPFVAIGLIVFACVAPFANKAIQTDDALFVWAGQWILKHPFDFYRGTVNWFGSAGPMWQVNWNPPLMSGLLAATASVFGWHEISLHLACAVITFLATTGIYSLTKMWCDRPFLATLIALFTPAFLISSTTLMCDLLMLSFWIWAMVFWQEASKDKSASWKFCLAGLLAGLAILTKYTAILLLPFLAVLSLLQPGKWRWRLIGLLIPITIVAGYDYLTANLYGTGLFMDAVHHAHSHRFGFPGGWTAKAIIGLTFEGGSLLPILFFSPWLWPGRTWLTGSAVIFAAIIGAFWLCHDPGLIHPWVNQSIWNDWDFRLQVAFFLLAGIHLTLLTVTEYLQRRDIVSLYLLIWIFGILIFAGILNWTVSARSFLPAVPAVAILAMRRLERISGSVHLLGRFLVPMLPAAAITLSLVIADYKTANLVRTVAEQFAAKYQSPDHQLWFNGHGGFQYYLEKHGARAIDSQCSVLHPVDTVAVLWSSGGYVTLPAGSVGLLSMLSPDSHSWMNLSGGNKHGLAGFYDADWGPVPFTIGGSDPAYLIAKVITTVRYPLTPAHAVTPGFDEYPLSAQTGASATNANPRLRLAEKLEAQGKIENAVQCYRKILETDSNNIEALHQLAVVILETGNPALGSSGEAVQFAMKAARLSKWRQPVIIETLAASYAADNQFSNAAIMAQAASELATLTGLPGVAAQAAKMQEAYSAR